MVEHTQETARHMVVDEFTKQSHDKILLQFKRPSIGSKYLFSAFCKPGKHLVLVYYKGHFYRQELIVDTRKEPLETIPGVVKSPYKDLPESKHETLFRNYTFETAENTRKIMDFEFSENLQIEESLFPDFYDSVGECLPDLLKVHRKFVIFEEYPDQSVAKFERFTGEKLQLEEQQMSRKLFVEQFFLTGAKLFKEQDHHKVLQKFFKTKWLHNFLNDDQEDFREMKLWRHKVNTLLTQNEENLRALYLKFTRL